MPCYTSDAFLQLLNDLLPTGPAYPRLPESNQTLLLQALADNLETESERACNLLVDAFPATTLELLPQWQAALGLPDPCLPPDTSIADQQREIVSKLTFAGGQ
jgi:uncharacterized protein YmfQ (DUF2313 family)